MTYEIETRRTDWNKCVDAPWYPNLSGGGYVAYRIWKQFDGLRWFQRHEWKQADGSVEVEDWIPSIRGFSDDMTANEQAA